MISEVEGVQEESPIKISEKTPKILYDFKIKPDVCNNKETFIWGKSNQKSGK